MDAGLALIGVLVGGLLAAHGAPKLFGRHLVGFWLGIAVLAGSVSAAMVLLAVARSVHAAATSTAPAPSTVSPAPRPSGAAGDWGGGDPRPR